MQNLAIGIDLGTADSYVAYITKGTVDIVQNEVSQRKTPSLVGFTDRERLLGDPALATIKSNAKNTCRSFKHLLGREMSGVGKEEFWSTCSLAKAGDGFGGYDVMYKGEPQAFSATVVTSMFFTKLIEITEAWCQGKVADAVIGVPSYFSDVHRRALLDAAKIAGLNVLSLMNEHAATALTYSFTRIGDFDKEKPMTVAFCMMGHAIFSVSIVQFIAGQLRVLSEHSDMVGGRDMDECMIRKFSKEFEKKYGLDPLSSKKAVIKLEDQVAKTKKILSANSEASCGCECLMEEYDFSTTLTRADFEHMCSPMKDRVVAVLEAAKKASGISVSAIDVVEICGGASRVPWVKEACSKAFGGKELSTRLNADECVARGCAQQAALLSKYYKTKELRVLDLSPFSVSLKWTGSAITVFPANSVVHLVKLLTFFRKETFEIQAGYADTKALLPGTSSEIGGYQIQLPPQASEQMVKVKAVLSSSGIFFIEGAQLLEATGEDADGRKLYKRIDLKVEPVGCPGYSTAEIERCFQAEEEMKAEMREIVETNARRNDLEGYILSMQSAAADSGKYGPYLAPEDREAFMSALMKAEDWLYDHIDDPKQAFIDKLAELKFWGEPAERRYNEENRRTDLVKDMFSLTKIIAAKASKMDKSVKDKLDDIFGQTVQWVGTQLNDQKVLAKYEDPVLTCADIEERKEKLIKMAEAVLRGDSAEAEPAPPEPTPDPPTPEPASPPPVYSGAPAGMNMPMSSAVDVD